MTRGVAGKLSKAENIDPLVLRQTSVATAKETVVAMDGLSQRIISGTAGSYSVTDSGDVLPPMPLLIRPLRPPGASASASASSSQLSVADTVPGSGGGGNGLSQTAFPNPQSSQASFATASTGSNNTFRTSSELPMAPIPQRTNVSQTLVRNRASSSSTALSWMKDLFPIKPSRAYYDITPLKPTPAVIPTFKCDDDTKDILGDAERATQRLWDSADCVESDRLRLQAQSAPIPQGPWKSLFGEDDDDEDPSPTLVSPKREDTPPVPPEDISPTHLRPVLPGARPSSVQGGRRNRSEPMLEFSAPTRRFRRHSN